MRRKYQRIFIDFRGFTSHQFPVSHKLGIAIAPDNLGLLSMNSSSHLPRFLNLTRWIFATLVFFPALLLAHPGHYHPPDETDEFDFLRSTFFHSHGAWDFVFVGIALCSLITAIFAGKRPVKVGAILLAVGSIVAIQFV